MERREQGRGLWNALRAKAGARKLDEQPDVVAALTGPRTCCGAPCDLAAAEAALCPPVRGADPPAEGGPMT